MKKVYEYYVLVDENNLITAIKGKDGRDCRLIRLTTKAVTEEHHVPDWWKIPVHSLSIHSLRYGLKKGIYKII